MFDVLEQTPPIESFKHIRSLDFPERDIQGLIPTTLTDLLMDNQVKVRKYRSSDNSLHAIIYTDKPVPQIDNHQNDSFLDKLVPKLIDEGNLSDEEQLLMRIQMEDLRFDYPIICMDHVTLHPSLRGNGIGTQFYLQTLPPIAARHSYKAIFGSNRKPKFFIDRLHRSTLSQLDQTVFGDLEHYNHANSVITVGFFEESEKRKFLI